MAFETAWQQGPPPRIDEILADVKVDSQTSLLAELVMIDFEHRWQRGDVSNLDSYFDRFPELKQDHDLRVELLRHEFQLRKSAGKSPTEPELELRFAGDPSVVELQNRMGAQLSASLGSLLTTGAMVGSYEIQQCIGKGAFAAVYSAVDTTLQRDVALKFLTVSDVNSSSRMRLRREAQAVASLKHPNILPVFGAGNYQGHDYVVARLVDGVTLDQWISGNPPAVRESVEVVAQLSSALDHAHRAGIVHRDIKPANVMIEQNVPILLDFGLAHLVDSSQHLTREGDVVGTPAFMPPEQADGRGWQADPRSDIYSLGALLFLMVFRRLPFEGTTAEIIGQILSREVSLPRGANFQVGRDLQTIILKCLEKEPSDRYQTADDLRNDLQLFLDGKPIVARPIGLAGRLTKWSRRRPAIAILLTGVIILAAFGGGAATQLRLVTSQRDRAQDAEKKTQVLLAASAADAGRLAMQRGKLETAVKHFEQAIDRGYPDRTELLLSLVEANFALRKIDESAKLLDSALTASTADQHRPAIAMWQAELALEGQTQIGNGEQLFAEASQLPLSPVDEQYVQGVLADSSLEAVERFRHATEIDPYHYRSRRMLIFMLLSLARVEESELQIRIARQLYPDDQDFLLLDGLNRAVSGDVEAAEELVQESKLERSDKERWSRFCRRIHEITNEGLFEPENDNQSIVRLHQLSEQFQKEFLVLLRERNWRFPPRISRRFSVFTNRLPSLLTKGAQPSADALEQLVAIHPESSLFLTLGALRLVGVSASDNDRKNQISLLEKSRDSFRLSLEYPGFLRQSEQCAWVSVFTTSMTLALVHRHEFEKNQKQYAEASRLVSFESVRSYNQARAFTIAAITSNDLEEADRWMTRWLQLQKDNDQSQMDLCWHQAILYKRHEDWLNVMGSCERILDVDANHPDASGLLNLAVKNIEASLQANLKQRDAAGKTDNLEGQ